MSTAISTNWECASCGSVIKKAEVLQKTGSGFKFSGPTKCACGANSRFKLLDFGPLVTFLVTKEQEPKVIAALQAE